MKRLWGLDMQTSGPTVSRLNLWLIRSFLFRLSFLFRKMGVGVGGWIQSSLWPVTLRGEGLDPWRTLMLPHTHHFTDEETEPQGRRLAIVVQQITGKFIGKNQEQRPGERRARRG